MVGGKRTKKDVDEAYHRGFRDGFLAAPSPMIIFLRAMWRRRKLKKLKKTWSKVVKESTGKSPKWIPPAS